MGVFTIPATMYFGNLSYTKQVSLQIHEDNSIINYFRTKYPGEGTYTIWTASGLNEPNLISYLNSVLTAHFPGQNEVNIFARNYEFYLLHKDSDGPIDPSAEKMAAATGLMHTNFNVNYDVSRIVTLNNFDINMIPYSKFTGRSYPNGTLEYDNSRYVESGGTWFEVNPNNKGIYLTYTIWPEGIFTPDGVVTEFPIEQCPITFYCYAMCDSDYKHIVSVNLMVFLRNHINELNGLRSCYTRNGVQFSTTGSGAYEQDTQNPYAYGGSSGIGGGDGKYNMDSDGQTAVPDLPDIDAADLGFVTIFSPTKSQLKALSAFMWSDAFNLATYKKLFSDPMQSIIGLAIVPVSPPVGGSKNVMFGTIDSGVNMNYCTSQYVKVDCGSVDIDKYVGSFLDYDYTKISIYLPYIGFRPLDTDDVMGRTISVEYNVDCLSGACAAFISVSGRGVMYSFNGSCISNIPLTSNNFTGAIQNAVTAVMSATGAIAGAVSGAAPMTAMGLTGLITSAANTAVNSKPDIQRSGNLGGSAGILSVQHPFVVIQRPDVSVPANMANYIGQCSNITMSLSNCHGFTMVDYIHLHDIDATSQELTEIETILKGGAIL